jgi:4-hydroxy-2-oxoheptanedioate aldolase
MNVIQQAVADGRPTFGVWSAAPSQSGAEVLGRSGIDWVLLDMQHGGVNEASILPLIQATELGGAGALVRVGWTDPRLIMRVLDLGAIGVVVPMVSTKEQATIAAQAVRYPPLGNRSFGPLRRFFDPASGEAPHTCIVMIETVEALSNLDDIVSTPGVDGVLVGPVDLAFALGLGLDVTGSHPALLEATDQVIAACRRHDKIPGGVAMNPENAELLLAHGMRLLTIGSDAGYLARGIAEDVRRAKGWIAANATEVTRR